MQGKQGKARQSKIRQGKARQSQAKQGKAKQGKARHGKAKRGKARQSKGKQGKARQPYSLFPHRAPGRPGAKNVWKTSVGVSWGVLAFPGLQTPRATKCEATLRIYAFFRMSTHGEPQEKRSAVLQPTESRHFHVTPHRQLAQSTPPRFPFHCQAGSSLRAFRRPAFKEEVRGERRHDPL